MPASAQPEFETKDRERLYEYIRDHEPVSHEELYEREVTPIEPDRYRQLVAVLKRDGYIRERDGLLRVAFEPGRSDEYATPDFDFTIRPARQEDLSGIVGVMGHVTDRGTYIVAESIAEQIDYEDVLIQNTDIESRMFFVALANDEVIGWVHLESSELEKLRHTAELTVGVLDEYRGHGIGGALMERGIEWAEDNGYLKVYQSIPATNEGALEFLDRAGWETEAIREDHYLIDGEFVDEVMMARYLD